MVRQPYNLDIKIYDAEMCYLSADYDNTEFGVHCLKSLLLKRMKRRKNPVLSVPSARAGLPPTPRCPAMGLHPVPHTLRRSHTRRPHAPSP
jgi:hypothetical protein